MMQDKNWTARMTAIGYLLGGIFVFGGAPAFGGTAEAPFVQSSIGAMTAPCGPLDVCAPAGPLVSVLADAPVLSQAPQIPAGVLQSPPSPPSPPSPVLQAEAPASPGIGMSGAGTF